MTNSRIVFSPSYKRQQGAVAIMAAVLMVAAVMFLAVVADTGRLYYQKRDLQKNADMAAMWSALAYCRDEEVDLRSAAIDALVDNGYDGDASTISINPDSDGNDQPVGEDNKVTVVLSYPTKPSLFGQLITNDDEITIVVSATAKACDPMTVFSIGTKLASLGAGESAVGSVLAGIGLDTELDLMSYNGLADVVVKPSGLLKELGIPVAADLDIADFNALLAANQVALGDILDATVELANVGGDLLALNATLISEIETELEVPLSDIQLGTDGVSRGLFASISSPVDSALDVGINALGLVTTAIEVATTGRAVSLVTDVPLELLGADITLKTGIVEPPSLGIGGIGTTAYTAQTRAYARIQIDTADIDIAGSLLSVLGVNVAVDIPLVVDIASASGEIIDLCTEDLRNLDDAECPAGEDCATVDVVAQVAKVCVGDIDPDTIFSTSSGCEDNLSDQQLLSVSLLGSSLISVNTSLYTDALQTQELVDLSEGSSYTVDGDLDVGETVQNLVEAITDGLLVSLLASTLDANPALNAGDREIAEELWEQVGGVSCSTSGCRGERLDEALATIENSIAGLQGFLADALLNPVFGLLNSVLSLDLGGILSSVGGLLDGLLGGLGELLFGDQCSGLFGSSEGCINEIEDALETPAGQTQSTSLLFLTGLLLDILKPVLDLVGNNILQPLLVDVIGLEVGATDVEMLTLSCRDRSKLVGGPASLL